MTEKRPQELKRFVTRVLKVMPRYNDLFTNGIPGYGTVNVGADPAQNLQRTVMRYAGAYSRDNTTQTELESLADDVEGALMMSATFELVTERNLDELIEILRRLTQDRQYPLE